MTRAVNKPRPARSLAELASGFLAETFKKQGFASTELVTRWQDIVGPEIARPRRADQAAMAARGRRRADRAGDPGAAGRGAGGDRDPAPVRTSSWSGSTASSAGRRSGGSRCARRRSTRRAASAAAPQPDPARPSAVAATLTAVADDELRMALGPPRRRRQAPVNRALSAVYRDQANVTARPWRTGPPMPHSPPIACAAGSNRSRSFQVITRRKLLVGASALAIVAATRRASTRCIGAAGGGAERRRGRAAGAAGRSATARSARTTRRSRSSNTPR